MGFGNGLQQLRMTFQHRGAIREINVDAVGPCRLLAAIMREQAVDVRPVEEFEHADIVVPGDREHPAVALARRHEEVEHALGVRPAIGVVAEMDDAPVGRRVAGEILADRAVHPLDEVAAPVNIADRVEPHAFGRARIEEVNALRHPTRRRRYAARADRARPAEASVRCRRSGKVR